MLKSHLESLLKHRSLGPCLLHSDWVGLGWSVRMYVSNSHTAVLIPVLLAHRPYLQEHSFIPHTLRMRVIFLISLCVEYEEQKIGELWQEEKNYFLVIAAKSDCRNEEWENSLGTFSLVIIPPGSAITEIYSAHIYYVFILPLKKWTLI